jgi:hypothetical protein
MRLTNRVGNLAVPMTTRRCTRWQRWGPWKPSRTELEQTVRKNNRTINTENNIHDLQDHIKDVMDALQGSFDEFTIYDEETVKTCESKDSDGLWKDEDITVSTFDMDSLVESQSSISFPQRFGRSPVEYEA